MNFRLRVLNWLVSGAQRKFIFKLVLTIGELVIVLSVFSAIIATIMIWM